MTVEFKQHFVAFLDILGFSDMVTSDVEGDDQKNLNKLYKCHQSLSQIFHEHADCSIIQFSDSVVISKPYDSGNFEWFVERVAQYQRMLIDEKLLCRGGIAVNKHYSNNNFTFSSGLISAYKIESKLARYPRVVVSQDVIDLVFPEKKTVPRYLVKEDDGLFFVDYLGVTAKRRPAFLKQCVAAVVEEMSGHIEASVREKGRWLAAYADATLKTEHSSPRFVARTIRS